RRRGDPGLMRPVEPPRPVGRRASRAVAVVLGGRRDAVADPAGSHVPCSPERGGEQPAPGGPGDAQELTTFPATFDSGSLTACRAWAIALVSAAVSCVKGTKPPMAEASRYLLSRLSTAAKRVLIVLASAGSIFSRPALRSANACSEPSTLECRSRRSAWE